MSNDLKNTKIIFMGTPEFSVPILGALIDNYNVVAVVTQPDKKVGRKQVITPPPVKELALEHDIEVLQPDKVKDNQEFLNEIKELSPDLIVVAAYGFILPQELLDIPKKGVINVHSSLLPKYRGPAPIQAAILNDDEKTGVTIMMVEYKMDAGDILSQAEVDIANDETFKTLHDKLAILGTHLLIDTLPKYLNNEIKPQPQDESQATYCQMIKKEDGQIDWSKSAEQIERMVRAYNPWPGAYTIWNDKKLKLLEVDEVGEINEFNDAGAVGQDLVVKCGQGALKIKKLQLEGKKPMTDQEFLNGYKNIVGSVLG